MNIGINTRFSTTQLQANKKRETSFGAGNLENGAIKLLTALDTFKRNFEFVGEHALTDVSGISPEQVKYLQDRFPNTAFGHQDLIEVLKMDGFDRYSRAESICSEAPDVSEKDVKKVLAKHSDRLAALREALIAEEKSVLSELGIIPNRN